MKAPVRCVVFDIDDTLYLERDYARSGFAAVGAWLAAEHGVDGFAERAWDAFDQGARGTIFDGVLAGLGVGTNPSLIEAMVERYRSHDPAIELLPDARACLEALHGAVAIAVVTDGPRASQAAKARALDLARWADPIVLTDELGPGFGKPHPRAFELVEERTGTRGAACMYVADNPAKDFGGPRALGWRCARVRRHGGLHHLIDGGPDHQVEDLRAIPAMVAGGIHAGA